MAARHNGTWINDTGQTATIVVNADGTAVGSGTIQVDGTEVTDANPLPVQQAALVRTVDSISAAPQTGVIMNGLTAVIPAFAIIDAAASGDNTLLAAQGSGNKIRVHSLYLIAAAAVTVRFESGAAGTALSGQMQFPIGGGIVLPFNPAGWFETAANTLLNLELSGAVSVDGGFQYSVVV